MNKINFKLAFKMLVALLSIWLLIHASLLQFSLLINLIHHPILLLAIFILFLIMVGINAWRWHKLNSAQNIVLGWLKTSWITYISTGFNNVLPGNIGGDIIRTYFLFKIAPQQKSKVVLSVMFDRMIGLMGIFTIICIIAIFQLRLFNQDENLFYILLFCAIFCMAGLSIFLLSILLPKKIGITTWLNVNFPNKSWATSVVTFLEAIRAYRNAKFIILECLSFSILIQLCMTITIILIAKMMDFPPIHPLDYLIAIGVTQLANLIPTAPGGLGIGEAAFSNTILLLNPSIPAAYATIFLAYRIIGVLVYLPGIFESTVRHAFGFKRN